MPSGGSRKRPAPGASPAGQQSQLQTPIPNHKSSPSQMSADQFLPWTQQNMVNAPTSYPDSMGNIGSPMYNGMSQPASPIPGSSGLLVRRSVNQPMVSRANYNAVGNETWPIVSEDVVQQPQGQAWVNNGDDLQQKAQVAKRDMQAKRKQIPPFVQKLSSFLDEKRNTDLIRWSERGDSFIVLDEDEFARTLIPELFKHNNYASFVRQLNMYGFHKKVGLSDNSMRASERKNKNPSEYYNSSFQRGRPDLLWLIQKPKNPQGKGGGKAAMKVKHEDEGDGDETFNNGNLAPMNQGISENSPNLRNIRQPLMIDQGLGLPREELANVQRELQAIRQQQQVISNLLQQTRKQHEHLYRQAAAFQTLHDRHESSINAILTFLATVYNRSLEGQGGQNFANMFAGAIPPSNQGRANVVDVGDYTNLNSGSNSQPSRPFRKSPLLLQAPPSDNSAQTGSPINAADSPLQLHGSPSQLYSQQNYHYSVQAPNSTSTVFNSPLQFPPSPTVKELSEGATPSNRSSMSPQLNPTSRPAIPDPVEAQTPEANIMSMINSANAASAASFPTTSQMDFPEALTHLQNADGNSPLTPHQRSNVLQLMASETESPGISQSAGNSALSLSPEMMNTAEYSQTRDRLNLIGNSLKEQEMRVNEINNILAPLSPSGSIPGLSTTNSQLGIMGEVQSELLDIEQFLSSGDYFNDGSMGGAGGTSSDFDFGNNHGLPSFSFEASPAPAWNGNTEGMNNVTNGDTGIQSNAASPLFDANFDGLADGTAGRVEAMDSSEATSPAGTIDEERKSPGKRRRQI